jgi:tetratricopeptide (TPR) repeat protein
LSQARRFEEAGALLQHVLDVERRQLGENHPFVANTHFHFAKHLSRIGKPRDALPHLEAASTILGASQGADSKLLVRVYDGIGQLYTELAQYADAVSAYERALKLIGDDAAGGERHASIEHRLAEALLGSGDRVRAKAVASSARARYVTPGAAATKDVAELDAWVAKHRL